MEYGRGYGKFCNGATKEVAACNLPDVNKPHCEVLPVHDCELGDWMPWTACSLSCGGGQKTREKRYLTHASNGGDPCAGPTSEVIGCNFEECPLFVGDVDCEWGDWSDWSACQRSRGQRHRFRSITQMAEGAGRTCGNADSEEYAQCLDSGPAHFYCTWGDWEPFGPCSGTCGAGIRTRQRHLGSSTELPSLAEYELDTQRRAVRAQDRARDVSMAFAAGFASLVAVFLAHRALARPPERHAASTARRAAQPESEERPLLSVARPDGESPRIHVR